MSRILVTGGAGFIGGNFLLRYVPRWKDRLFLNGDSLSYASNPMSLIEIEQAPNYRFSELDLRDADATALLVRSFQPDVIVHFAAETHVDRSIKDPISHLQANVNGTVHLLEAARQFWNGRYEGRRFHHVSTDEVYGSLGPEGAFLETTPYDPSSPYSASKAASDHFVRAYHRTYGLPITISNCSNNYGPRQFPEKLIPLMTLNAAEGKPLPVYGKGENIRDWLHVDDHNDAIAAVLERGRPGETYNVGGGAERNNLQVVHAILDAVAAETGRDRGELERLIQFVTDRPGHDFRYAIDASKIRSELGWSPRHSFEDGIRKTVAWYLQNPQWVEQVRSGAYRHWIEKQYGHHHH